MNKVKEREIKFRVYDKLHKHVTYEEEGNLNK